MNILAWRIGKVSWKIALDPFCNLFFLMIPLLPGSLQVNVRQKPTHQLCPQESRYQPKRRIMGVNS